MKTRFAARAALPLLSLALMFGALATARAFDVTPDQQQACENDAFRLCSAEIPDASRVAACLDANEMRPSRPCYLVIHAALMQRAPHRLHHHRHHHKPHVY